MKEAYLSTREVADLLSVTETTIKRWTDSGSLDCVKTLGGHRKYLLKDIEEFAEKNNIAFSGMSAPLQEEGMEKLGYALYSKNIAAGVDVILKEALKGNREGIFNLLMYLVKNRLKFVDIIDQIINPVLDKVGKLWETNKIKIEQEHLASDTIRTALARLVVYLPHQIKKETKVICACCEGENHDIGIQALAYELELSGYTLQYLGANTPFESLVNILKKEKPDYLCLSATSPSISKKDFIKGIQAVALTAKKTKTKLITGGIYFRNYDKETLGSDKVVNNLRETMIFIKNK